jgi:hypothetical protein
MNLLGRSERELAAQTLADFERDGLGHHLDNADADVLRAMVRLSVERHQGAVAIAEAAEAVIGAWDAMDGTEASRGALMGAFGGLRLALGGQ